MDLKSKIISSFANFIIGSDTFDRVKAVVIRQDNKNLSGIEKREAAFNEIRLIGMGIATWAINLAIELAVSWLRTKAAK